MPAAKSTAKPTSAITGVMKTRKKNFNSYSSYILKVLKAVHPDASLSKESMSVMNSLIHDIYDRIMEESRKLVIKNKQKTLSHKDIEAAISLVFGKTEIGTHAQKEGARAIGLGFKSK